ncbi:alpha-glycosidase [[Ruminococcus] lactaris]|uniref:alpha-glycosidase n=1 Tax=[Ruminococcus] lactaris TaxID=46228 RepID=UPI001D03A0BF|nr:alpha-glycosidase [[Ruminococcus] lactaris]MCB5442507.1 glycoside hydrolase family 13 protein [[Ruminococcus] lactaris]MCB5532516.1 glycoside hydrolase family 13 protein [[Ruminococcus] lactaris]
MNREALFCDGTGDYVIPAEPEINEKVVLRFRTAHNDVDEVKLHAGEQTYTLWKMQTTGEFDFYEIEYQLGTESFHYYFEIKKGTEICYFSRYGVTYRAEEYYSFIIQPGFSTPEWAKGAVMYQIFVDRFYNGDPTNDVEDGEYIYIGAPCKKIKEWSQAPASMDIRNFYGGDLQGVMDKLDYLQELGIEVIYFNPLFVSPSNHKYDIQDYDYIDPHYGKIVVDDGEVLPKGAKDNLQATKYQQRTGDLRNLEASNQLFAKLVDAMHQRGMKVILDGVFNHCGSFNKWMDRERIYEPQPDYPKGAYVSADSPYRSFFLFHNNQDSAWPYNGTYDGWWGHDTLPKLAYEESPALEDYIMRIGKKWVSAPYNIDGWRLDVAADLGFSNEYNHLFWKRFRKEVKSVNPDALILAEHYGDPQDWLQGDEWDSVMNYDAFMEPVTWFLTGMEKHSDERRTDLWGNADNFIGAMRHFMASMLTPSLQVAMNELSNHDHSRFLTRTNHKVGRVSQHGTKGAEEGVNPAIMREAVVIQMTWVGAPTVYYGDEAGLCGFTDPDNRRTYPWGREDQELLAFHKEMIRIHKTEKPLRKGSIKLLAAGQNLLAYGRFEKDEQLVIIVNNSSILKEVTVPVWLTGMEMSGRMKRLIYTYEYGYTTAYDEYIVEDGEIVLNMGAYSAIVLKPIDTLMLR